MQLAYVYVDCGDARYKKLVHEMVQSAKRVMPEAKITQISDRKTPLYPDADRLFAADLDCNKDSICAFKGHFMAEFAMQCQEPLILCDVDLIWQKPVDLPRRIGAIGILERSNMPSMPFNTGMILSQPKYSTDLWKEYQEVVDNLHANGMGGWYCDQIAAAICWHNATDNGLPLIDALPMNDWAYTPSGPDDQGGKDAYAIHLKGDRKKWLPSFLGDA